MLIANKKPCFTKTACILLYLGSLFPGPPTLCFLSSQMWAIWWQGSLGTYLIRNKCYFFSFFYSRCAISDAGSLYSACLAWQLRTVQGSYLNALGRLRVTQERVMRDWDIWGSMGPINGGNYYSLPANCCRTRMVTCVATFSSYLSQNTELLYKDLLIFKKSAKSRKSLRGPNCLHELYMFFFCKKLNNCFSNDLLSIQRHRHSYEHSENGSLWTCPEIEPNQVKQSWS